MVFVDDTQSLCGTEELLERHRNPVNQGVADRFVGQDVVWGDTELSGVHQLDPRDSTRGDVEVGVGCDDHRALAAQF